jgi:glycosyltransferase involved in cell wall biosynthesis
MKVLMVNTPASQQFQGGDLTQLRKTAQALQQLGVETGESFELQPNATGYDVAHVFNLRTLDVTLKQVTSLANYGIPVVLSPIYLNVSLALWATRALRVIFNGKQPAADTERLLGELSSRQLRVHTPNGQIMEAKSENRPQSDYDDVQRKILAKVHHLLPNSYLEHWTLARTLRVVDLPFTVVPYAAEAKLFLDADPEPFAARTGLRDFIMQAGRVEWPKNQLMLLRALRDTDLPVVLVGKSLQPDYLEACKQHGPKHLKIFEHLPHEELRSAYAAARVHVLPSWVETCGLVTMEAALANCNVVGSIAGFEVEYFTNLMDYVDPGDVASIRRQVLASYENYPRQSARRQALKDRILQEFTWEKAAQATLSAYRQTLGNPA